MTTITINGVEAFISTFTFNKAGSVNYQEIEFICNELTDEYVNMLIDQLETYISNIQNSLDEGEYKQGTYYFNTDPDYISYEESDEELEALDQISKAQEILNAIYAYERPSN